MEELRNYLQASKARKETPVRDACQISNRLHEVFDRMAMQSAMRNRTEPLLTGYEDVDEIIGGLELGELVAIDGERGSGKTAMMLGIAIETARSSPLSIMIYSQTHSAQQLARRLLSMLTGVPIASIEAADLSDAQWNLLSNASTWLKEKDIRIIDLDQSIPDLCASINRCDTPALVIVDGLPTDALDPDSMKLLKELAQEKNCCVLFGCSYYTNQPYISGKVDKVFSLDNYHENEATCEITWNRTGKNGCTLLLWHRDCLEYMPFTSAAADEGDE